MRCKFGKQLFVGVLGGSGVLIHAQHPRLREELCQFLLGLLGAKAPVLQLAAAGRASGTAPYALICGTPWAHCTWGT